MAVIEPDGYGPAVCTPPDVHALIERFEKDIVYDAHSLRAKYSRSQARAELVAMGTDVIVHLFVYLKTEKGLDYPDLPAAWAWLVKEICARR